MLATTAPMSVPTPSVVATPASVATPLALVVPIPTAVPWRVNRTVSPAMARLVTAELRVAVKVAVPPKEAVPPTLARVVAALLTTRSPVPVEPA